MSNKKIKPHDALIKKMMEDPEFAKELMSSFLPEKYHRRFKWETLVQLKDSWVDDQLREHLADAVFEVAIDNNEAYTPVRIAILLEHKSYPDNEIVFQLLQYLVNAYRGQHKKRKKQLMPVLPFVLYHGKKKWKARSFESMFSEAYKDFMDAVPLFEYTFKHVNLLSDQEILALQSSFLQAVLLTQKYSHDPIQLMENLNLILNTLAQGRGWNYYMEITVYVLKIFENKYSREQILEAINSPMEAAKIQSLYDQLIAEGFDKGLEQGIQQGIEKGLEQGLEQGLQKGSRKEKEQIAIQAYKEGIPIPTIRKITGLTEEELKNILPG